MDAHLERRHQRPDPPRDSGDPELIARIRAEVRRDGPMTFARFMERALYEPDLGYYRRPLNPADRGGDFLTAPELHPIFGAALARAVADAWRTLGERADVTVREYGAGSGALSRTIVDALPFPIRYEAVEINDHRRASIAPPAVALSPDDVATAPPRSAGVVLANEFLDALPVHRIEGREGGIAEVFVDWSDDAGGFVDRVGPASATALQQRLTAEGITLEPGQRGEIALGVDAWVDEVARAFERSVVIVIDYGHPATDLYAPKRRAGTLLGYLGHRVVDDPYANVGRQDLTAHVDFTAVEHSARAHGFTSRPLTTQAAFLVQHGLEDLLERARARPEMTLAEYTELRSAIVRLIDPRAMGGFRVLVLDKGLATAATAAIG